MNDVKALASHARGLAHAQCACICGYTMLPPRTMPSADIKQQDPAEEGLSCKVPGLHLDRPPRLRPVVRLQLGPRRPRVAAAAAAAELLQQLIRHPNSAVAIAKLLCFPSPPSPKLESTRRPAVRPAPRRLVARQRQQQKRERRIMDAVVTGLRCCGRPPQRCRWCRSRPNGGWAHVRPLCGGRRAGTL